MNFNLEVGGAVLLLQTKRKPRKWCEASATVSSETIDLGAFLGMPRTQVGSPAQFTNRLLMFLDAASFRWTSWNLALLSNGTGSGRNAVSPKWSAMTVPCWRPRGNKMINEHQ